MSSWSEIDEEIRALSESPAGKALAAHGFKAAHQGGGIVNFERDDGQGGREHVVAHIGTGEGPRTLEEPIELVSEDGGSTYFPTLTEWILHQVDF